MSNTSYVVYLEGCEDGSSFKHFLSRVDAEAYALSVVQSGHAEIANGYSVDDTLDPRKAVAAVKMGEGRFLFLKSPHRTPDQIKRDTELAWEKAMAEGPDAMLKMLDPDA